MASAKRQGKPDDDDFTLAVEPPRPLISPGVYAAASTSVRRRRYRHRPYLEVLFDVFEGSIEDGVVIARGVPGYFNLPADGRPVGRSSRLGRLLHLLNSAMRLDRVRAQTIKGKYLRVRVVTVNIDGQQHALSAANHYSKVAAILERLA